MSSIPTTSEVVQLSPRHVEAFVNLAQEQMADSARAKLEGGDVPIEGRVAEFQELAGEVLAALGLRRADGWQIGPTDDGTTMQARRFVVSRNDPVH